MSEPESTTDVTQFNQVAWDRVATAGDELFVAATQAQIEAARNGDWKIRVTPVKSVPREWINPVAGRRILLLAGGGGQQGPILAAAGANVTVFDLSNRQLQRDIDIAASAGLNIETIAGEMTDLSAIADQSFELIINPCSVCYVADLSPIWSECHRVLADGGSLISGMINPVWYLFDAAKMDRGDLVARHKIPYSDYDLDEIERAALLGHERPREFGHSLDAMIGDQIAAGFAIDGFYQDRWGDDDRLSDLIDVFFATRATKLRDDR